MRWIKLVGCCLAVMFIVGILAPAPASAQYFGNYGAGFTPSPQALYATTYGGPNTGSISPNGWVQGEGYPAPQPMYASGYGYRPMPLGQAIATAAVITAINNRNYGYGGYGYRGGYGGFRHHHHYGFRH